MIAEHTAKNGTRSYYVRVGRHPQESFSEADYGSRKAAKAAAKRREGELLLGGRGKRAPVTCSTYAERFLGRIEREPIRKTGRKRKDSTVDTARYNLARFTKAFGHRHLSSLTVSEAIDWVYGPPPQPAGTVKTVIQMFNAAIAEDAIERNPFAGLSLPSDGRRGQAPPTPEQFQTLLDAWSVHGDYAPMGRAVQLFAGHSGMRPGELFALEWSDIDFDARRIDVNRRLYAGSTDLPKSNKPRRIVLTSEARDALLPLDRVSDYVFVGKRGGRLSQPTFWNYWQKVLGKADMDFDFYLATRHYFAWQAFAIKHRSVNAIAQQMGWSRSATEDLLSVYGHGDVGWEAEYEDTNVVELKAAKSQMGRT